MTMTEQFHAILALPIGAAVLACATCFFFCIAALVRVVIDRKRENRARLRSLAARFPGAACDE